MPKEIKKKFKIKKKIYNHKNNKNFNYSDKRYIKYLKDCFSDKRTSFDDAIKLSYPWFFPPNYKRNSRDEDSIFNQKIRDKKIIHKYVFPAGGLFKDISKGLRKLLKQRGIKIKLNKPLKFNKLNKDIYYDGFDDLNNSKNIKIICIPVKPLSMSIIDNKVKKNIKLNPIKYFTGLVEIKNFRRSNLDNFAEIITASKFAVGLKRIALYSDIFNITGKKIYQIEFLEHQNKTDLEQQIKDILFLMSKFIEFKDTKKFENNIRLIGFNFIRNAFRPKKNEINLITKKTIKFFDNKKDVIFPRQITWPINSNKHFIYANNDYKKIIKKNLIKKI